MKGRVVLIVGLAAGYVLGARAGRERYEQIKEQADKVWQSKPVQDKVDSLRDLATSNLLALPSAIWNGAVKVGKAATSKGSPGQKLDRTLKAGEKATDEVQKAAKTSQTAAKRRTSSAKSTRSKATTTAKRKTTKAADAVKDTAATAKKKVDEAADTVKDKASKAASDSDES